MNLGDKLRFMGVYFDCCVGLPVESRAWELLYQLSNYQNNSEWGNFLHVLFIKT